MFTIGLHTVVVLGHAVEEDEIKDLLSQDIRVAVVQHARLNVTELFRATRIAVVVTVRGLGTPGSVPGMRHIATSQNDAYYEKPKLRRNIVSD